MSLPVDPKRLRAEFPDLSDADLEAYVKVTERILGELPKRAQVTRAILATGEQAQAKEAAGTRLTAEEKLALGYRHAVEKMQRSTVKRKK
jgi:hypothetical protein